MYFTLILRLWNTATVEWKPVETGELRTKSNRMGWLEKGSLGTQRRGRQSPWLTLIAEMDALLESHNDGKQDPAGSSITRQLWLWCAVPIGQALCRLWYEGAVFCRQGGYTETDRIDDAFGLLQANFKDYDHNKKKLWMKKMALLMSQYIDES